MDKKNKQLNLAPKVFGARLKIARVSKSLSQNKIARRMGVDVSTYGKYERGLRAPDALFVYNFCEALQINYIWLFTGKGPVTLPSNPSGLEAELLKKIIAKVEEHLQRSEMLLNSAKKAEIISILYEEALENQDWQKQQKSFDIDNKTMRFIKLLAEKKEKAT